jgi:hypothetical protein
MKMRIPSIVGLRARPVLAAAVAALALAALSWIALAYLQPGLRKAILYSGFGLC